MCGRSGMFVPCVPRCYPERQAELVRTRTGCVSEKHVSGHSLYLASTCNEGVKEDQPDAETAEEGDEFPRRDERCAASNDERR